MAGSSIEEVNCENCGNHIDACMCVCPYCGQKDSCECSPIMMLQRAADNSSKALKEGHAKESKLEKTIMNSLSWVTGGAQGSGVDSAANIFSRACAIGGLHLFGKREYYSNIKGEHSYFTVRISDETCAFSC